MARAEDDESVRALHKAIDLGLNFIDTALAYGEGHSEKLIGKVLRERDETVYIATKVPPSNLEWPARPGLRVEEVFSGSYVKECTPDGSLAPYAGDNLCTGVRRPHRRDDGRSALGQTAPQRRERLARRNSR